ncbi:MAG: (deoxy)nucleoside triphosphate pyrophosphohydrolase [Steroidobacteraceae bacterium]
MSLNPPGPSGNTPNAELHVVAGALFQGARVLIAQRPEGKPMAGWWEFPGGKVHAHESAYQALVRELHEELGVEVLEAHELIQYTHRYPERSVHLELWHVTRYTGEPRSLDQQALKWVAVDELEQVGLLEGDGPMITVLKQLHLK